jgi:hypothetical protein
LRPSFLPPNSRSRAPTFVPSHLPTLAGRPTIRGRIFTTAAPAYSPAQYPAISSILSIQRGFYATPIILSNSLPNHGAVDRKNRFKEEEIEIILNSQKIKVKVDNEQKGNKELSAKAALNSYSGQEITET